MMEMYHKPVLLEESIIGLRINPNGIYVDATFGGGGHSKEILSQLNSSGRLIAFDQDQDAIENKLLDKRLNLVKSNFKYLSNYFDIVGLLHLYDGSGEEIFRIHPTFLLMDHGKVGSNHDPNNEIISRNTIQIYIAVKM